MIAKLITKGAPINNRVILDSVHHDVVMAIDADVVASLPAKFDAVLPHLDERQQRLVMAADARSLVSRVRNDFTVSGCDNAVCRLLLAWKSGARTSRSCVPGCGPRGFWPAWRSGPGSCCWSVKSWRTPRSPPGSG